MRQIETKVCRHGRMSYFDDDMYIGKSLRLYGNYSEGEVDALRKMVGPNDVCVEVGSNIGALTIPLAKMCRKVYAFEPQPDNYDLLLQNLRQNDINNVRCLQKAVGSSFGNVAIPSLDQLGHLNYGCIEIGNGDVEVPQTMLDEELSFEERISFIKMDCEGSELATLKGAEETIRKHRPILYIENDRAEQSSRLVGWVIDHGYDCFWNKVPLFHAENFFREKTNIFGNIHSHMMICIPRSQQ
jgi:FkbM family methyltransferase